MSNYSYIKTVFPKFEHSKVYNDKLYSDLTLAPTQSFTPPQQSIKITPVPVEQQQHVELSNYDYKSGAIVKPLFNQVQTKIETFADGSGNLNADDISRSGIQYYNKPIINNNIPHYDSPLVSQNLARKETFTDEHSSCSSFIKHINHCEDCRIVMMKQFNIESDRIRNEELMELISYIMFGVFILLLFDQLKK
jgi:hypothetical protein